jgi:hypothetical protein
MGQGEAPQDRGRGGGRLRPQGDDAMGSLSPGFYDEQGTFHCVGHHAKTKREIREMSRPFEGELELRG